jgi:hypothetical protein
MWSPLTTLVISAGYTEEARSLVDDQIYRGQVGSGRTPRARVGFLRFLFFMVALPRRGVPRHREHPRRNVGFRGQGERLAAMSIDRARSAREDRLRTLGRTGLAGLGRTRIGRRTVLVASADPGHEIGEGLGDVNLRPPIAMVSRTSPLRPCVAHRQTVLGWGRLARRRGTLVGGSGSWRAG